MRPSSAKGKGRALQQFVAKVLVRIGKKLEPDDAVSRPMGSGGVDIMMSPLAQKEFPFSLECKNTKSFPSVKALEQSQYNKYDDTLAAVVWKPFGKGMEESIIYFNYVQFVEWYEEEKSND